MILNILGVFFLSLFSFLPSHFSPPSGSSRAEEALRIRKEVGRSLEALQPASPGLRGGGSQRAPVAGRERGPPPYSLCSFVLICLCKNLVCVGPLSFILYSVALQLLAFAPTTTTLYLIFLNIFNFFSSSVSWTSIPNIFQTNKEKFARWHRGQDSLALCCGFPLPFPGHLTQPCKQVCRVCGCGRVGGRVSPPPPPLKLL